MLKERTKWLALFVEETIKAPSLRDARQQLKGLAVFLADNSRFSAQMKRYCKCWQSNCKNDSLQDQPKPSAKYCSVLFFKLNSHLMSFICRQTSCASECLVHDWCQN